MACYHAAGNDDIAVTLGLLVPYMEVQRAAEARLRSSPHALEASDDSLIAVLLSRRLWPSLPRTPAYQRLTQALVRHPPNLTGETFSANAPLMFDHWSSLQRTFPTPYIICMSCVQLHEASSICKILGGCEICCFQQKQTLSIGGMHQGAEADWLVKGRQLLQQQPRWDHRPPRRWPRAGTTPRPRPLPHPTWASTLPCPLWVGACLCWGPTCAELRALWKPLLLRQPLLMMFLCREPSSMCGACCPASVSARCLACGRMLPNADSIPGARGSCQFATSRIWLHF